MDTKKIGSFLKMLRKEKGFTQEQLGEKVGVTNKTISRWETGCYMPPIECLDILSDIYGVSINEIVAGERIEVEMFKDTAEKNLSSALTEIENNYKKFENRLFLVLITSTVIAMAILFLLPLQSVRDIIIFVLVIVLAFISNTLFLITLVAKKESEGNINF